MSKQLLLAGILWSIFSNFQLLAQETINGSIIHDNIERDYILYVPLSYEEGKEVPLVFNFHGYTSNAFDQMNYGDFRPIADTAGFIIVHPMGTIGADGETFFNAEWGAEVDDIGFANALIDSISEEYSINLNRVYSTGMSNGGFMSYTLACNLGDRFAAIASVTGAMTTIQLNTTCFPESPTPIMEIHGTSDAVVPYNGNNWMAPIDDIISLWVSQNECTTDPLFVERDDIDTNDGSTVEQYIYADGVNGNSVELLKIIGGGHTWPGTAFSSIGTNLDINASAEVWRFFSQFDINGSIASATIQENVLLTKIFPNPSVDGDFEILSGVDIDEIHIYNLNGELQDSHGQIIAFNHYEINLRPGVYFVQIRIGEEMITKKLVALQ